MELKVQVGQNQAQCIHVILLDYFPSLLTFFYSLKAFVFYRCFAMGAMMKANPSQNIY
jgi:hypothetical protein